VVHFAHVDFVGIAGVDLFDRAELLQQLARGNWPKTRSLQFQFVDFAVID
jgi:hypothetical protein